MKYATYENYKNSASEWPGLVPSHWHVDRLKWSTTGCYNGVWGDEPNEIDDLICVRVADFDRDQFVVVSNPSTVRAIEIAQRRNRILQKNDLLIEKSGGGEKQLVGCVVQFTGDFPAVCSNFVARLPVARGCDPRYLTYLHSAIYAARLNYPAIKQTTGIQNLDSGEYLNILAAYPPLAEQQTIARFLDAKTAQIDALVAQKRQLIAKLKEKRQALIARTVTRGLPPEAAKAAGLEPNPEMKDSGVDWLGAVPAHWGEDKVARLFRAMKGRNAAQLTKEYCATIEGEFPVYSGQTENDGVMSSIDEFEFDAGEDGYLFSTTVGAKAMSLMHLKGEFSLSQNCMVIAPMSDKVQVRFYYYHLQPLFQFERGLIPEHMQASFRMEDLYQYRVAIPPKAEQRAIADYLDQMCAKIDDLLAVTDRAIAQLNEYRQALITSAVTGKIDVRNWQSGLEAA